MRKVALGLNLGFLEAVVLFMLLWFLFSVFLRVSTGNRKPAMHIYSAAALGLLTAVFYCLLYKFLIG